MDVHDLTFLIIADKTSITWSEIKRIAARSDESLTQHQLKSLADQAAYVLASDYGWRIYDNGMEARD